MIEVSEESHESHSDSEVFFEEPEPETEESEQDEEVFIPTGEAMTCGELFGSEVCAEFGFSDDFIVEEGSADE